mgnify:CR=1 FL=1
MVVILYYLFYVWHVYYLGIFRKPKLLEMLKINLFFDSFLKNLYVCVAPFVKRPILCLFLRIVLKMRHITCFK